MTSEELIDEYKSLAMQELIMHLNSNFKKIVKSNKKSSNETINSEVTAQKLNEIPTKLGKHSENEEGM